MGTLYTTAKALSGQGGLEDSGHKKQKAVGAHVFNRDRNEADGQQRLYEGTLIPSAPHGEGGKQGFSISNCQTWASIQDENRIFTLPAETH